MSALANGLKSAARAVIPPRHRQRLRRAIARAGNVGLARYCPCCGAHLRRFEPFGVVPRPEARCPACGSLERHRLICLYLRQRTDLFDGRPKRMLHVAPEPQLARLFRRARGIDYLSADLTAADAMVALDVTDIPYPDGAFDVIYCSHVLEHVPDDRRAIGEFRRVLKPDGWAILQVPINAPATFEDPSVVDPAERERLFGQRDHVRRYGPDYCDRLVEAGFAVTVDGFARELPERQVRLYGLMPDEDVYLCRPAGGATEQASG